jgi:hypothetical protein
MGVSPAARPAGGAVVNGVRLEATVTPATIISGEKIKLSVSVVNEGRELVRFFRPEQADMDGKRNWRLICSDGRMFRPF